MPEGKKSRQFIEQVIRTVVAQIEGDGEMILCL